MLHRPDVRMYAPLPHPHGAVDANKQNKPPHTATDKNLRMAWHGMTAVHAHMASQRSAQVQIENPPPPPPKNTPTGDSPISEKTRLRPPWNTLRTRHLTPIPLLNIVRNFLGSSASSLRLANGTKPRTDVDNDTRTPCSAISVMTPLSHTVYTREDTANQPNQMTQMVAAK